MPRSGPMLNVTWSSPLCSLFGFCSVPSRAWRRLRPLPSSPALSSRLRPRVLTGAEVAAEVGMAALGMAPAGIAAGAAIGAGGGAAPGVGAVEIGAVAGAPALLFVWRRRSMVRPRSTTGRHPCIMRRPWPTTPCHTDMRCLLTERPPAPQSVTHDVTSPGSPAPSGWLSDLDDAPDQPVHLAGLFHVRQMSRRLQDMHRQPGRRAPRRGRPG